MMVDVLIGKRAKRAIYRVAENATRSRGSPRSFAAQSALAQDDKGVGDDLVALCRG
jgi:hypothetical protein